MVLLYSSCHSVALQFTYFFTLEMSQKDDNLSPLLLLQQWVAIYEWMKKLKQRGDRGGHTDSISTTPSEEVSTREAKQIITSSYS